MPSPLEIVVSATQRLLPPAAPHVLGLLASSSPDLEAMRKAVELDPVLTVRMIDYANHSFYARRVPVASLQRALVRLGWQASCDMLAKLMLETAAEGSVGDLARPIWEHSLRVGVLTRLLARDSGIIDPGLAFTAGLVHAIGQLGLLSLHRESYVAVFEGARSPSQLARHERRAFGFDHAAVGAGVLRDFNVPGILPEAIARMYRKHLAQRDWSERPDLALAAAMQLAQALLQSDQARLESPDWITKAPIAIALHQHTQDRAETLAARFEKALALQLGTEDAEEAA